MPPVNSKFGVSTLPDPIQPHFVPLFVIVIAPPPAGDFTQHSTQPESKLIDPAIRVAMISQSTAFEKIETPRPAPLILVPVLLLLEMPVIVTWPSPARGCDACPTISTSSNWLSTRVFK